MDLNKALRELHAERERVDRAINALEAGLKAASRVPARNRRGRKMMSPEERLEVSRRMSAYWEARRAAKMEGHPAEGPAQSNAVSQVAIA